MARIFNGNVANFFRAVGLVYNLPTNCTIVWRAKTSSDSALQCVLGRRPSDVGGGFRVCRNQSDDSVLVTYFSVADIASNSNVWPADGSQHNFIFTKSGTTVTFYVDDGATAAGSGTATYSNGSADGDLIVGGWGDYPASILDVRDPFNGSLWDVAIFPSVLDGTDRAAFMAGTAPSGLSAAGSDHFWPLDNAAEGNEDDDFGSADLTENGTVGYEATGGGGPTPIEAGPGSYTLTGQSANLLTARRLTADAGSYALAGQDVTLTKGTPGQFVLTAEHGTYLWEGENALADYAMNAEFGTYSLSGQDATFSLGVPAAYTITCDNGLYSLTGRSAILSWSEEVLVTNGNSSLSMSIRMGI